MNRQDAGLASGAMKKREMNRQDAETPITARQKRWRGLARMSPRDLLLLASLASWRFCPSSALADPPSSSRIHLHGSARIDAHAARAAGKLSLAGTLLDDAGRAMPREWAARVALTVTPACGWRCPSTGTSRIWSRGSPGRRPGRRRQRR